ncbi:MAG: hypothetical protein IKZ58_01420 [Selenomonadaceae bacterium]|nr:hypothetical protein [Selenomonadaceae bacterium]
MKGRLNKLKIFVTIFAALIVALKSNFCSAATLYSVSYGRCRNCGAEVYLIIRVEPTKVVRDDRYNHSPCPYGNRNYDIVWYVDGQLYWYDERTGQWTRYG